MANNIDLFLKKTRKEFEDQLKAYKQKLLKLANKDVDYAFLQSLIDEVAKEDIEIVVEMANATMTIRKQKEVDNKGAKPRWD